MLGHSGTVRLKSAILCVNCEVISNSNTRCDVCGSLALLNLSRVLGNPISRQTSWEQVEVPEATGLLDKLFLSLRTVFSCVGGQPSWTT